MANTASQVNPLTLTRLATGTYIEDDTAVAVTITCGFTPRYVRVCNETSGDMYEWFESMADAEALKQVTAGTRSIITTLGITPVANSGFTIGLDTDVNAKDEQISWLAMG